MRTDEARILLGLSPNSGPLPTPPSQLKAAYRQKVLETHPDRFTGIDQKALAESKFKMVSEAYAFLSSGASEQSGFRTGGGGGATYSRVVRTGVPRSHGGGFRNLGLASVPFVFIIFGAVTLGGSTAARAYRRQKEAHPSFNPFLP